MSPAVPRARRSPLAVTLSVWKALFLRETLTRLSGSRAAWFWLIAEPVFHVTFLTVIYTVINVRTIGGIDSVVWVMVGMLAFFSFRRTATQVMQSISANQALFAYRQVKPVDTALARAALEAVLLAVVTCALLAGAALRGHDVLPTDALTVMSAFTGLWVIGLGFGLITSVLGHLVPELSKIINFAMMPLYLISGVAFPLSTIQQPYRDWLMLNPLAQGIEAARTGFSSLYHAPGDLDLKYVHVFALTMLLLGLALHRRFATKLVSL
jgi:capsular polysaccharide transport system permease protein